MPTMLSLNITKNSTALFNSNYTAIHALKKSFLIPRYFNEPHTQTKIYSDL